LNAAREIDDAAILFAKNRAQIEVLREAVRAAKRSLDIATIQYREGLVDFERVLDSQRTLFSQQDRYIAAQGDTVQSLVALYKAMGGGWQTAHAQPVLDDATRATMNERSSWKGLLEAPLPPGDGDPSPSVSAPTP
jgi:outer membrane protein, multidrug efflux system